MADEVMIKWAKDMTTDEIIEELDHIIIRINEFESATDEDKCHGGSPGEWLYERHEELTIALSRRVS